MIFPMCMPISGPDVRRSLAGCIGACRYRLWAGLCYASHVPRFVSAGDRSQYPCAWKPAWHARADCSAQATMVGAALLIDMIRFEVRCLDSSRRLSGICICAAPQRRQRRTRADLIPGSSGAFLFPVIYTLFVSELDSGCDEIPAATENREEITPDNQAFL